MARPFVSYLMIVLVAFLLVSCVGPPGDATRIPAKSALPLEEPQQDLPRKTYIKLDERGRPLPDAAEAWSMVHDPLTGLIWEVKDDVEESIHFGYTNLTWEEARKKVIDRLNEERFGGFSDWRLPTVQELAGILDLTSFLPAVNRQYFPHTDARGYWTGTPDAREDERFWRVHFCRGYINPFPQGDRLRVRAVRGAVLPGPDLKDNGDGTVTDRTTGLMWQQSPPDRMPWEEALRYCRTLKLAGCSDWRLPSAEEARSIVAYPRYAPAMDVTLFHGLEREVEADYWLSFWTSTSYASNPESAWLLNAEDGSFFHHGKDYSYHVRAVRAAVAP